MIDTKNWLYAARLVDSPDFYWNDTTKRWVQGVEEATLYGSPITAAADRDASCVEIVAVSEAEREGVEEIEGDGPYTIRSGFGESLFYNIFGGWGSLDRATRFVSLREAYAEIHGDGLSGTVCRILPKAERREIEAVLHWGSQ